MKEENIVLRQRWGLIYSCQHRGKGSAIETCPFSLPHPTTLVSSDPVTGFRSFAHSYSSLIFQPVICFSRSYYDC